MERHIGALMALAECSPPPLEDPEIRRKTKEAEHSDMLQTNPPPEDRIGSPDP